MKKSMKLLGNSNIEYYSQEFSEGMVSINNEFYYMNFTAIKQLQELLDSDYDLSKYKPIITRHNARSTNITGFEKIIL